MENFLSLGLPKSILQSLEQLNFTTPTPIQAQAIPVALEGKDILGSAQTGTGKTAAFGIPLIAKLLQDPKAAGLIMTPTRELAVQVTKMLESLINKNDNIKTALLIGGDFMPKQIQQLKAKPRLIIGTPGRINDHLLRGTLYLKNVAFFVLDETDRMLDMGFSIQIEKILKHMPTNRQTLLFSATMPKNIVSMAERYMNNPVNITIGTTSTPAEKVTQETINLSEDEKYTQLIKELESRDGSVIVFVNTKRKAEKMATRLKNDNHSADAMHGDLRQNKRDRVISAFRAKKHRILVATDIAARGLDIPHIEHVINFDLPQCPEDYIHRIGRTARAGSEGCSLCLISPADKSKWRAISRLLNPSAQHDNGDEDSRSHNNDRKRRPYRGNNSKFGRRGARFGKPGAGKSRNSGGRD
jgi:ATP-dependent RNA helicase DeaD